MAHTAFVPTPVPRQRTIQRWAEEFRQLNTNQLTAVINAAEVVLDEKRRRQEDDDGSRDDR